MLHTSRTNPSPHARGRRCRPGWSTPTARGYATGDDRYDLTPVVLDNIAGLGLDALITIGGDDTLSFSRVLVDAGVPLVGDPQDDGQRRAGDRVRIGFSSAVTRAKELINRQRTTLGSHERIGVFRIFGRDAGFSACTPPT